ncbi:MAG: hypothetical protein AB8G15_14790 [Saprospiraceae bacterium]
MRIIGHLEHSSMKITVFQMDNKYSVKFETSLYEQTYKFRQSEELQGLAAIETLVDDQFQAQVLEQFQQLHRIKSEGLGRFLSAQEEEEFDEII